LGRSKLAKAYDRYGFNKVSNSELEEVDSRMPEFSRLSDGDLAQAGIGQASMLVTPLRMAMVAAAFANDGVIMKPYIVNRITAPDGSVIKQIKPQEWLKPMTPELAQTVKQMMLTVVSDGTGTAARIAGIHVAGKTGSAENPHGAAHAWFIGFAPAENPEIAVAVIVENGGSGGGVAAPIARQVIAAALH
jgi:peptidoglycan glycosyltransferase